MTDNCKERTFPMFFFCSLESLAIFNFVSRRETMESLWIPYYMVCSTMENERYRKDFLFSKSPTFLVNPYNLITSVQGISTHHCFALTLLTQKFTLGLLFPTSSCSLPPSIYSEKKGNPCPELRSINSRRKHHFLTSKSIITYTSVFRIWWPHCW